MDSQDSQQRDIERLRKERTRIEEELRRLQAASSEETVNGLPVTAAPAALSARYEILAEVGRGGMGIVYKARDRETGEVVALKVLRPEIAADEVAMERFKNELRLARKITHKNVCRIHEFNRTDDTAYISMEFVEGESLRHILNRFGNLSVRKGLEIAGQICAGLREAHSQGVTHRDLKPENVMLDRAGQVKVMDFGIARSIEAGPTLSGGLIGTPAYMAPEQAEGKTADHRADLYALGLILYEMFTGAAAFRGDTPLALVLKQIQETPPPPRELEPTLPAQLEKAIVRCLEKNPAQRFQSVDELETALAQKPEPKPAEGAREAEEVPLPLHLALWQRSDYWLLALGILATTIFLYLFDRTYPYSAGELRITRHQALDRAGALARKFDPAAKPLKARYSLPWDLWNYPRPVLVLGLAEANGGLRRGFGQSIWGSAWGWEVDLEFAQERRGTVAFNSDGRLVALHLPRPATGNKPPAQEEVLGTAIAYIRDFFGEDVTNLSPTRSQHVLPKDELHLMWRLPGPERDSERRLIISFGPEGLRWASHYFFSKREQEMQNSEQWRSAWQSVNRGAKAFRIASLSLVLLALLILIVFFTRRLYQRTSPSALFVASCAILAVGGLSLPTIESSAWTWLPAATVGVFFLAYALLRVPEHYLARALPARAGSWLALFRERLKARSSGLSPLRGCALGSCYLAVHTALLSLLGAGKLAGPGLLWLLPSESHPSLLLYSECIAIVATIGAAWCLVAFPAALAARVNPRPFVLVAVPTGLWLVTAFSLPGASAFPLFPLFLFAGLQGLFFSYVLYRYDFLTVVAAIFTVETWLLVYPVYTMFHKVEFLKSSLAMLPWFLLFLLGLTIYLRPQFAAAWRRVVAVFE